MKWLDGPDARVDASASLLTVADPQKAPYRAALEELSEAIEEMRVEFIANMLATSDAGEFRELEAFIAKAAAHMHRIIVDSRNLARDLAAFQSARSLVGAISSHALLRDHIHAMKERPTLIGGDLQALEQSYETILTRLDVFRTSLTHLVLRY